MVGRSVLPEALKYKPTKRAILPDNKKFKGVPPLRYEWSGVFEGWARGFVSRNFWRVREHFGEPEDAVQECAIIFVRCCQRYNGAPDQPKLMMAYFKSAVVNDFHTFAIKDGQRRGLPIPPDDEQIDFSHGPLAAALANASDDLKQFLRTIEQAPADFLSMIFADDQVANINRRLRRLCGIKAADVLMELRTLLS